MPSVLVVEDSRTQAMHIRLLLEEAGFSVRLAYDGREGLDALARGVPDVVLTDLQMPELDGLSLVEAAREDHPGVPVVLMTASGSEDIAVQALRAGAASYVPKRNLARDIVPTLTNVIAVAQAGRARQRVVGCLTESGFAFDLENDPALVPPLIGYLEDHLDRLGCLGRNELMRVGVALHEAILNAIHHGNLGVSSALRQDGEEAFHALVEARRREAPYRDRRVHVTARFSPEEAAYVIADEGPGFDPSGLPDPTDPANLGRVGGRGLLLIRTFMDRVEHNAAGNRVTLVKRCRPAGVSS
jgi:CheY-like chemotaxis protein